MCNCKVTPQQDVVQNFWCHILFSNFWQNTSENDNLEISFLHKTFLKGVQRSNCDHPLKELYLTFNILSNKIFTFIEV